VFWRGDQLGAAPHRLEHAGNLEGHHGHGETNLHNLLDSAQFDDERVLNAIVVMYGVALPLIDRFSEHGRRFLRWIGMPVPPLALAGIFLLVLVTHRHFRVTYPDAPAAKAVREYAEAGYAAAYLMVAVSFLFRFRVMPMEASARG
jgi:hypothetical protein